MGEGVKERYLRLSPPHPFTPSPPHPFTSSYDKGMARFTILEHDHPTLHWDLLLEAGETLRTWRLAQPPEGPQPIPATPLPDHRLVYLDYEGPVSGNRGVVRAWDRGTFAPDLPAANPARLELRLHGGRVNGTALLWRQEGGDWVFQWIGEDTAVSCRPAAPPDALAAD